MVSRVRGCERQDGWTVALVLALAITSGTALGQPPTPLPPMFNGRDLTGWIVEAADASVHDGAMVIQGPGWVRSARPFADFVLTFEARTRGTNDVAAVWVRAWPTVNDVKQPNNGYQITLSRDSQHWHQYKIRCVGHTIEASSDGSTEVNNPPVRNPQGFLLLRAEKGTAEFRNIVMERIAPELPALPEGIRDLKGSGVVAPRLLRSPRPSYTSNAMRQRIQGAVLLSGIIGGDGVLTNLTIVQSLDPHYGLDEEAVAAAKGWRFAPATLDGVAVPVRITIELTFTLTADAGGRPR